MMQTVVGIWVWSMYRDPKLFANPDEFHPERFMGDPQYANDDREALKPFFTGTRDCVGRGYVCSPSLAGAFCAYSDGLM